MRTPWQGNPRLLSGAGAQTTDLSDVLSSLDKPDERKNLEWGAGGAILGLFVGLIAGSKLTFHSPVRRRQYR